MSKSKTKLEIVQRRKTVPKSAFKKGNPHRFQPDDERINRSGKAKNDLRLVSRSLRDQLGQRAPAQVCDVLGLPRTSSWSICISRRLLHLSFKSDEALALAAIRAVVELSEQGGAALIEEMSEAAMNRPVLNIHFIGSNGDGRPDAEGLALESALDGHGTIDGTGLHLLGPET